MKMGIYVWLPHSKGKIGLQFLFRFFPTVVLMALFWGRGDRQGDLSATQASKGVASEGQWRTRLLKGGKTSFPILGMSLRFIPLPLLALAQHLIHWAGWVARPRWLSGLTNLLGVPSFAQLVPSTVGTYNVTVDAVLDSRYIKCPAVFYQACLEGWAE